MIRNILSYSIAFVLMVLVQVWILNNIQLSGYINPYLYILFLLILPFGTAPAILIPAGFFLGLTIDLFMHTAGLHAAACVLAAFMRPVVLSLIAPGDGYDNNQRPHVSVMGFGWFLRYVIIMVLLHHTALFYLEVFRFSDFFLTLARVLFSSFFTIVLILVTDILVYRK
jgi:hypothetical protein